MGSIPTQGSDRGLVVRVLDSGVYGRGFDPHTGERSWPSGLGCWTRESTVVGSIPTQGSGRGLVVRVLDSGVYGRGFNPHTGERSWPSG